LAEDRTLYPVLDQALATYKRVFATNTPVVNATMTALSNEMKNMNDWNTNKGKITAYVQNGRLTVTLASGLTAVSTPVTVPAGSSGSLPAYGGNLTGWSNTPWLLGQNFTLPTTVVYGR
jgi:hypothetical protein